MIGQFEGIFVGIEGKEGKNGIYYIVRVLDEKGQVFESIAREDSVVSELLSLEKLSKINFKAEIEKRFNYTNIKFLGVI